MMRARRGTSEGRRKWRAAALLVTVCAWNFVCSSTAQTPKESDVEAAYLFNFAKFMHEPAHSPDSFTIAVVGKSPIGQMLDTITTNEQIDGRPLKVVHATTIDQARNCDIVFLSETETPRMDKDIAALAGSNALTVSNLPDFLQHGGMIQFQIVSNRVRFSVNLDAVSKAKITLSSELLKVAMSVTGSVSAEAQP
jgi:YfiR/HmsC-like